MPIATFLAACSAVMLAVNMAGCGRAPAPPSPRTATTCELRAGGAKYDGVTVAVHGVIRTDLMHFQNLESPGCEHSPVSMYFATKSKFNPCGESAFAEQLQCPLNALDWKIEATFVGTFHSANSSLEVRELSGFTRTKRAAMS